MSLKILESCINCDVCEPVCPNKAISFGSERYRIDPQLCTECKGQHDEPQCLVFCPVEGAIVKASEEEEAASGAVGGIKRAKDAIA